MMQKKVLESVQSVLCLSYTQSKKEDTMISNNTISVDRQHHDDPDLALVLKDILAMDSPCDTCSLAKHCKDNFEACNQFYLFIHREDEGERAEDDLPSRKIYAGLFPEETDEDREMLTELNERD